MIQLTPEQDEALASNGTKPIRVMDCATNVEYVLLHAAVYERLENLLSDDLSDIGSLMNEVMAEDDAHDPYLESYQQYG
jgi:hypothetical protein